MTILTLKEFIKKLNSDVDKFEAVYEEGVKGPNTYPQEMDTVEWYEQFEMWLSTEGED